MVSRQLQFYLIRSTILFGLRNTNSSKHIYLQEIKCEASVYRRGKVFVL